MEDRFPEYMVGGSLKDDHDEDIYVMIEGSRTCYDKKGQMIVLGDCIDITGSTTSSMSFNLGRAETLCFCHQQVLRDRTLGATKRLQRWRDSCACAASFASETWHITAGLLSQLRTWELQMLRRMLHLRRRPMETFLGYNQRTSVLIDGWLHRGGIMRVYTRIMRAIFKNAWKECWFALDCGDSPMKWVREARTELWWETIKVVGSQAKRRRLGIQRKSPGKPTASWEHPFVVVWGLHWRGEVAACSSGRDWMHKFPHFMDSLSSAWNLPWLAETKTPLEDDMVGWYTVKLPAQLTDTVPLRPNQRASRWGNSSSRVWIQTDNQTLEQIFNGRASFDASHLRPVCVRISRHFLRLLSLGRKPRLDECPFIEWDPRSFNSVADHAANVALDLQRIWSSISADKAQKAFAETANLRLCVDGARRGDGASSAGVALFAYSCSGEEVLLGRAGKCFGYLTTSFLSELQAVESALQILMDYVTDGNLTMAG